MSYKEMWTCLTRRCGHVLQGDVDMSYKEMWTCLTRRCGHVIQGDMDMSYKEMWTCHTRRCGHIIQGDVDMSYKEMCPEVRLIIALTKRQLTNIQEFLKNTANVQFNELIISGCI